MGKRRQPDPYASLEAALRHGDYTQALRASTPLLHTEGADSRLWHLHGRALEKLNQLQQALAHYQLALQRFGEDAPLLVSLGNVHSRLGQREPALRCFERAQRLDPDLLDSYRGQLAFKPIAADSPIAARVLRRALDVQAAPRARARALFLLAQIHAEEGRTSSAFEYCRAGNGLLAAGQSREACEYSIGTLRSTFSAATFAALPPEDGKPCPLVVIAGLPRSGKSLVETLLASQPGFHAAGELALVRQFASSVDRREPIVRLGQQLRRRTELSSIAKRVARVRATLQPSPGLVSDTSPANLRGLGYLGLVHPEVPVVLCRREAQELGLALYFKNFKRGHFYSLRLDSCGRAIARAEALMDHWAQTLPNPLLQVRYEELVTDPQAVRGQLLQLLGLNGTVQSIEAPPKQDASRWRLFPSRSLDGLEQIRDDLLGFSAPYAKHLAPMRNAYNAERARLARQ